MNAGFLEDGGDLLGGQFRKPGETLIHCRALAPRGAEVNIQSEQFQQQRLLVT